VETGLAAVKRFVIENRTGRETIVPAIVVSGADYQVVGQSPAGQPLPPLQSVSFEIRFAPAAAGTRTGSLAFDGRNVVLTGIATEPPPPQPQLSVEIGASRSAEQGRVRILLDAASRTSASGLLALEFRPAISGATDPAVAFSSGSRQLAFTVQPGDVEARFPQEALFQTGTTAGTLVFTATLGTASDTDSVIIAPEAIAASAISGARTATGVEVRVTGFDNTRSTGRLGFTFYDRTGTAISPGTIRTDNTNEFARYFQGSDLGGVFLLHAAFPVTGNASEIEAFEVELTNSEGTARTARVRF
jgi:hypothetical protein